MSRLEAAPNQIDSVWHEWGEGNTAVWPSEVLPRTENVFPRWWEAGIDPVKVLLDETRKRGREVFFSYRINGSDNDDLFDPPHRFEDPIPLKARHPDWLIHKWHVYWDFRRQGVRDLKLAVLREVAAMYDYDGISVDFARVPVLFPEGEQWKHRDLLTGFMRQVRSALHEIGRRRGRPYLLAARVPEDIPGCRFDGIDVETWAAEGVVDILVIGTRTAAADVAGFRALTGGTPVRLYPSWDDHHSSDGYRHPTIEVWRGVCANWWRQQADGMHTFNLMFPSPESERCLGIETAPELRRGGLDGGAQLSDWETQCRVFAEIGSPETLAGRDKVFLVERRGGGHGRDFVPAPDDWYTPRHSYFQTQHAGAAARGAGSRRLPGHAASPRRRRRSLRRSGPPRQPDPEPRPDRRSGGGGKRPAGRGEDQQPASGCPGPGEGNRDPAERRLRPLAGLSGPAAVPRERGEPRRHLPDRPDGRGGPDREARAACPVLLNANFRGDHPPPRLPCRATLPGMPHRLGPRTDGDDSWRSGPTAGSQRWGEGDGAPTPESTDALLGKSPFDRQKIWDSLTAGGRNIPAASGIEMALWDLAGKGGRQTGLGTPRRYPAGQGDRVRQRVLPAAGGGPPCPRRRGSPPLPGPVRPRSKSASASARNRTSASSRRCGTPPAAR